MKATRQVLGELAVIGALALALASNTSAHAQVQLDEAETSVVSALAVQPLASPEVPTTGTFYLLTDSPQMAGRLLAPLPCPPAEGVIYPASAHRPDVFLADCRARPRVDADLLAALVTLRIQLAAAKAALAEAASAEMSLLSGEESPPLPGDGGTTNPDNGGGGLYGVLATRS